MAKLIGTGVSQVPTNGDLGTLAFQDSDNVIVENLTVSGSSSKLVVEDNSTDAALRVTQTGSGNALVVEDSANPDATAFIIDASGNVLVGQSTSIAPGVGNTTLGAALQSGAVLCLSRGSTPAMYLNVNADSVVAQFRRSGSAVGSISVTTTETAYNVSSTSTGMVGDSSSANVVKFQTNGNERMRIDSSGNVGIKEGSPQSDLHISDSTATNIRLEETTGSSYSVLQTDTAGTLLAADLGNNRASTVLRFSVDGSERLRIDSSGNVGIGVTSPSYQLELSTDSAGKPSTNTWTVVSDERIKENIELADLDLCYDAVKNIPLKRFKWRDEVYSEEQVADRHKLGWIAQDVETVYPKAVNIHEFKYNQVYSDVIIPAVEEELDEDGNIIREAQEERTEKELVSEDVIEDCRNLNADQIYAAMYGAIQKLIQKVESQQSQIDALTARIEGLEATP